MVVHISTLTVTVLVEPCIVEPIYMATQTHTPGVSILEHVQNLTAQFCLVKIVHFPTNCMNTNAIRNPKPLHTDRASRTYTVLCQNASWLTCCTVLRLRESLHSTGVCLPAVCFLNVCKSFSDNSGLFCNWKGVLKWGQQPIKMLTLCFSSCTKKSLIRAIKKQALKEFRNLLLKKKIQFNWIKKCPTSFRRNTGIFWLPGVYYRQKSIRGVCLYRVHTCCVYSEAELKQKATQCL